MTWNDVMSNVRQKLGRGFGWGGDQEIQVAYHDPRVERLEGESFASPAVDVYENDHEVLIQVDVPGGKREDAVVSWDEISGLSLLVRRSEQHSGRLWRSEYEPRSWYRAFQLPEQLDGRKASSRLKNGVLTIHVPKRMVKARLIPVKAG